ncbi:MAG: aminoacyl-tRNA hydrolase [Gammaproteobacteria bacterium]|nr:aminoacyl-tRNA hydrolase [Gammaproteobacteria bacterium]
MQPAVLDPGLELIVGLGNPGDQYAKTRHNAGFWLLDRIASRFNLDFRHQSKFRGDYAELIYADRKIALLKPTTFMNLSGQSVAAVAKFYKIPVNHILIVHDDLDLPVGGVKLKLGGGHGGHNGLRDMVALGSKDFWRLRIGIDHPGDRDDVVDYVLKNPSKADRQVIDAVLDRCMDVMELILDGEMEKAMHQLHTKI